MHAQPAPRYVPPVADGHEQWFIDESPKNRMILALLSNIDEEINWSLFRLAHLSKHHGQRFWLDRLFGLTDALMEWPLWWIKNNGGIKLDDALPGDQDASSTGFWHIPKKVEQKRKHALESLIVIRNASLEQANAQHLSQNYRIWDLMDGLKTLPRTNYNTEFINHLADIFHGMARLIHLPPPADKRTRTIPLRAIQGLVTQTKDRTLLISLLSGLATLYNSFNNNVHIIPKSPVLETALLYLPLAEDRALVAACLDYIFAHISHPPAAKALLHHPELPNVVKLLATMIVVDQEPAMITQQVGPLAIPAPQDPGVPLYQLTADELQTMIQTPEPHRTVAWLTRMYAASPGDDESQGTIWTAYRDTFMPHELLCVGGIANASDLIRKVLEVFPQSQAVQENEPPPPRYVIRGIKRRIQEGVFKCRWDRGACNSTPFQTVKELHDHLIEHLQDQQPCLWASCQRDALPLNQLKGHVLTHLPPSTPLKKTIGQPDFISLPLEPYPHPSPNPTQRPPPPPPPSVVEYRAPAQTPPSTSLTALLILRIIFRASFPDSGPAPPVSDEHKFGFPMPPALGGEIQALVQAKQAEMDVDADKDKDTETRMDEIGQRNGRRAFRRVAVIISQVRMADQSLTGWIEEMVSAAEVAPFL